MSAHDYNLFWVDIESTGLDPLKHCIIEIAGFVTNCKLEVISDMLTMVVKPTEEGMANMNPIAQEMHRGNGLLKIIEEGVCAPVEVAESFFIDLLRESDKRCYLAGNSVHFDRMFLKQHMPELEGMTSHRNYDVSTLMYHHEAATGENCRRDDASVPHRALEDIIMSYRTAKYILTGETR